MDERIKGLIDFTKEKYGLDNYYLKSNSFDRYINIMNETIYTLSMEWVPNCITDYEDEGSNPEGTAVIEIEVATQKTKSVIFVGGKTFANGISLQGYETKDIIKWIEDETGLSYGSQFQLHKEEKGELHFKECFDGIPVSPSGFIEVRVDDEGNLTMFSIYGQFPSKEIVREEKFTLSLENMGHQAKEQLQLIKFPSIDKEELVSVYGVEEVYVANSDQYTIPFEFISDVRSYLQIEETMYWDEGLKQSFDLKEINWSEEITSEQAYLREPSPESYPITNEEAEKCVYAVKSLLSQQYPNQSGDWILKTLHRDKGYIQAILRLKKKSNHVFQRKVVIFIDPEQFQVVNYMDNKEMLEMFDKFGTDDASEVTKEQAYEKLKHRYTLKPYYVYDYGEKQYILCGKIDCEYGIKASNGEIVSLQDL